MSLGIRGQIDVPPQGHTTKSGLLAMVVAMPLAEGVVTFLKEDV